REREGHRVVDPQRARRDLAVAQDRGHERGGRLVLLPGPHVLADLDLLERAVLLEGGGDPGGLRVPGQHRAEEALREAPARAREVLEAAAGGEHEGLQTRLAEAGLGPRLAPTPLLAGEAGHARGHGLEGGDRGGPGRRLRGGGRRRSESGERGGSREPQEVAPSRMAIEHGSPHGPRRLHVTLGWRMTQSLPRVSLFFLSLLILPSLASAAYFPPSYRFRTLKTPRVSV